MLRAQFLPPVQRAFLQQRISDMIRFFVVDAPCSDFLEGQAVRPGALRQAAGGAGVAALAQREPDPGLDFVQVGRLPDPDMG